MSVTEYQIASSPSWANTCSQVLLGLACWQGTLPQWLLAGPHCPPRLLFIYPVPLVSFLIDTPAT